MQLRSGKTKRPLPGGKGLYMYKKPLPVGKGFFYLENSGRGG